jgi:CRP/FNR family transcriptional regulator, cyclic AMP receptor protein
MATQQFTQADLFWGMSIEFIKSVTDLAVHITCHEGDKLFENGDQADRFYILLKGSVIMERGKDKLYTAEKPGEIFGWSALIHRDDYAASATCNEKSELLNIKREPFLKLLENSPKDKATLYDRLAKMLGNQLLEVYITATC